MRTHCQILFTLILLIFQIEHGYSERVRNASATLRQVNSEITTEYSELDIYKICAEKPCIAKCCPTNKLVFIKKRCIAYDGKYGDLDFSNVLVYDKNIEKTTKSVKDVFHIVNKKYLNMNFSTAYDLSLYKLHTYLTESGLLYVEFPNAFKRWTPRNTSRFCIDYQFPVKKMSAPEPRLWVILDEEHAPETNQYFVSSAMLISCFFLLLVLIVYALLPELRNLCGMVLIAYVFSLLGAFFFLATLQILSILDKNTEDVCRVLTFVIYFFFLATFCWMNVMSFDIWWTFRGYAKARPIHRRGEKFKFLMYCLYAFGLPLSMTIALNILDRVDLTHIPWFITPKITVTGCFIEDGERLLYLYVPMLILVISNWIFFLMTAYNVWRLNRGTAVLDTAAAGTPAAHRSHQQRFLLYLKLSLIMGINWVLEVISSLKPELTVWYITDGYNLLIGLAIFLIFVCKRKILRKLVKKFRGYKNSRWSPSKSQSSSTTVSGISQDTPLQICTNPKGPGSGYY